MAGQVVHFEIPTDNLKRAQTFYQKAFGWQINHMAEMNYTMVGTTPSDKNGMPTSPGAINGGMFERETNPAAKNPVVTIAVENIDTALKTIKQLGGTTLVEKQSVGDMGWSAYFKDPEGNVVGLWQAAQM